MLASLWLSWNLISHLILLFPCFGLPFSQARPVKLLFNHYGLAQISSPLCLPWGLHFLSALIEYLELVTLAYHYFFSLYLQTVSFLRADNKTHLPPYYLNHSGMSHWLNVIEVHKEGSNICRWSAVEATATLWCWLKSIYMDNLYIAVENGSQPQLQCMGKPSHIIKWFLEDSTKFRHCLPPERIRFHRGRAQIQKPALHFRHSSKTQVSTCTSDQLAVH